MMFGKNIYIWNIEAIYGGDCLRIAQELKAAGFESAILHESGLNRWHTAKRIELVTALKAAGIIVIGGAALVIVVGIIGIVLILELDGIRKELKNK